MSRSTDLIHHAYLPPAEFEAPQVGVFKASTVIFPNVAAMRTREWMDKSAYTYGLHGTPTTFTLEERLATLEGGKHCILAPSGLAAIAHVDFALLKTGDEVLIPDNAYAPNKSLAEGELAQFGITHQVYDPLDVNDLAARITPRTRLVWLEAAGSVTMEFPDLVALVQLCKARGVLCALDNTWGAGLAFNAFDLTPGHGEVGVDLTIHALTKYPSGGGDVLMGSIVTRSDELARVLKLSHMRLGTGVGPNDAEMVLRSLASMPLRYKAQDMAARTLAACCTSQTAFSQVLHPALTSSPGHEHWQQLCVTSQEPEGLAAGIFSVVIDARFPAHQVDAFCDSLKLFKIGYSWGGPMSLVMPYNLGTSRTRSTAHMKCGRVVRFCIGLEDVNDLQRDIAQALHAGGLLP
ncbi:MAG: cystathionine beta-lyase [Burkholderiales bacterium 35-55-47]|jgi:cystathionine beta-lyase|uniref:PLP-dependent transferase n=1 Tax=Limnohabitans sp. TaxID=1907725 RepID=UPI000BCFE663|nr:PLP-dependent transferase [Limnohabitans sp.]OYY19635.1 MAG: cystathionine beta-lyase [Burkholderiales bacterium 35-55-47]OYZ74755.1 MAG: cystathionine beta-lyase [Burkholderiales bacterium 24-55-52]OZB01357.1 MAG: cystathionine beta-lyase [Burkholderiales bacterium 39-55-53]HQR85821.1 PLP-dependent transferase [Limnohabitans sp.]HQS26263.1 PLP-dependent transferase [Limnohabitans sp.]